MRIKSKLNTPDFTNQIFVQITEVVERNTPNNYSYKHTLWPKNLGHHPSWCITMLKLTCANMNDMPFRPNALSEYQQEQCQVLKCHHKAPRKDYKLQ